MGSQRVGHDWATFTFTFFHFAYVPLVSLIFWKRSLSFPFYCFPLFLCIFTNRAILCSQVVINIIFMFPTFNLQVKSLSQTKFIYTSVNSVSQTTFNNTTIICPVPNPQSSSTPNFSSSVQLLSCVRLFETPWITARQASLSITNSWSLLKLMPIESVMPSSHLILCRPLLLLPPSPPRIRVFSNKSTLRMR